MTKSLPALRAMLLVVCVLIGCSSPKGNEAPEAWNNLNAGMTRQEISAMLGRPASHLGASQDTWRKGAWELQVSYDENGRARDILRRLVAK
jgi:outer membrane protein assembly factor BamE (lipoprotein component of BamABCDE complex)